MSSASQLDKISLSFLDSYKMKSGLSKNDLLNIQNELISFLKTKPELKCFREKLFDILFILKRSAERLKILNEHDNYYESMSILLNYYMELEILALNDPGSEENNLDVFNRIYSYLNNFLNHSELNIVKTFVHYFVRDNNITDLKEDLILKDLFCKLFEKLFLTKNRKNGPKGNELEFFIYLFIFKLWHYVCSTNEEKNNIEQLIPLLYKFDTDLSSFIMSKKYVTHTYYDNGSYIIKEIKERILKMLSTEVPVIESSSEIANMSNTPHFDICSPYKVQINWLSKLLTNSVIVLEEDSDDSDIFIQKSQSLGPNISDATTIPLREASNNSDISIQKSQSLGPNISDATTIPLREHTSVYVSSNNLSSNNIEENMSSVSTVHLHYPESEDRHDDASIGTTLSVLNIDSIIAGYPSSSSFFTASTNEKLPSNVSDESTAYMTCPSNEDFNDKTADVESSQQNGTALRKTMRMKAKSSSPRSIKFPKLCNGSSHIRILERKDYIKPGNSRNRTFSMFRDECLTSKQNLLKRSNNSLDSEWKEIKQCSVKIKRLDDFEIEAFKNKKLPLEYFSRTYSNNSSNDEHKSENSIDLNDSNISIEILEETLGSRAYLYCREVQKTLENETKKLRKRAKSCYNY